MRSDSCRRTKKKKKMSLLDSMRRNGWGTGKSYKGSTEVVFGKGSKRTKIPDSREV